MSWLGWGPITHTGQSRTDCLGKILNVQLEDLLLLSCWWTDPDTAWLRGRSCYLHSNSSWHGVGVPWTRSRVMNSLEDPKDDISKHNECFFLAGGWRVAGGSPDNSITGLIVQRLL